MLYFFRRGSAPSAGTPRGRGDPRMMSRLVPITWSAPSPSESVNRDNNPPRVIRRNPIASPSAAAPIIPATIPSEPVVQTVQRGRAARGGRAQRRGPRRM